MLPGNTTEWCVLTSDLGHKNSIQLIFVFFISPKAASCQTSSKAPLLGDISPQVEFLSLFHTSARLSLELFALMADRPKTNPRYMGAKEHEGMILL